MGDVRNIHAKLILTDEEGGVRELEGKSIIFYLVQQEGDMTVEGTVGVFGGFSASSIDIARDNILTTIDQSPSGKRAKIVRDLEGLVKGLVNGMEEDGLAPKIPTPDRH